MIHFEDLCDKVADWHYDRNLIDGSTDRRQLEKLSEEMLELVVACHQRDQIDIEDALGDMMVVMINIAERNDTTLFDCLERAYNIIKDRKGRMVNGKFVKEDDL